MASGIVKGIHPLATTGAAFVTIAVKSIGSEAALSEVTAMVDTGFDGNLALPEGMIKEIGLQLVGIQSSVLADGREARFKCYLAEAHLDGEARVVRILQSGEQPLVGMNLLWERLFSMNIRHNGLITIS